MNGTKPEDAGWEVWDRNRLLKLMDKLPSTIRHGVSQLDERTYSVFRVWEDRSVHLLFSDRTAGKPRTVSLTRSTAGKVTEIAFLAGGLRAWIDALEISRDELLEALL